MRIGFAIALTVGLICAIGCGTGNPSTPATPAAPSLDGDYRVTKTLFLGRWMGEKRKIDVTIKGETMTITGGLFGEDASETIPIKTDSSKNPATIDLVRDTDGKVDVIRGIYKLNGDETTIILGLKDRDKGEESRPKDFTENKDVLMFVMKRK